MRVSTSSNILTSLVEDATEPNHSDKYRKTRSSSGSCILKAITLISQLRKVKFQIFYAVFFAQIANQSIGCQQHDTSGHVGVAKTTNKTNRDLSDYERSEVRQVDFLGTESL